MVWRNTSLTRRIFFAIALTAACIVAAMAVMVALSMRAGFARYLLQAEINRFDNVVAALARSHNAEKPGWAELADTPRAWSRFVGQNFRPPSRRLRGPAPSGQAGRPPGSVRPGGRDPLRLRSRLALLAPDKSLIAGAAPDQRHFALRPILAPGGSENAKPLGYLRLAAPRGAIGRADNFFLAEQIRTLIWMSVLAILLSALAAWFLARQILAPLRELSQSTGKLASGDYSARIENTRKDELGVLIDRYNGLAQSLEKADQSQRQWISNTSHELQTPLAILRAEIEALQDGVRQPAPAVLAGLHASVMRLSLLVKDLNTLAQTREGEFSLALEHTDLRTLVDDAIAHARKRIAAAGLTITIEQKGHVPIRCDRLRMRQLADNLLENACRYTTAPGEIAVCLLRRETTVSLIMDDTPPVPPATAMDKVFERFYRVEASRSRAHGGSGLGLSICKAIAEAHNGNITASPSPLGGLRIEVTLPLDVDNGHAGQRPSQEPRHATASS